ncbi:MAG: TonB-dependent receptor [Hyphomonadaceae bacterium]
MHRKALSWIVMSGASLAAMAHPAFAQDQSVVSDEIVVTATGREAAIQDVPIAVTAVSGETVENSGVETLLDMEQLAPALRIYSGQSTSAGTIAAIRGIGTGGDNPGFESAVGIFIDGVYRARAGVALSDLPELERIEILRGPQGTLFGRNTSMGAISVVTAGPDFETGAWLEGSLGDLDYGRAAGGVNIPLNDSFAVRFDGSVRARDGYMTDILSGDDFNTQNRWSARAQALWDITPDMSLRLIADTAETDEDCCAATPVAYGAFQAIIDDSYIAAFDGSPLEDAFFLPRVGGFTQPIDPEARLVNTSAGRDFAEAVDEWGLSGELSWAIGGLNFTSVTSYRDWEALRGQDIDFNEADIFYRDGLEIGFENFTQEFRLQGEAGILNWLVGAYYGDETLDTTDRIRFGADTADYLNGLTIGASAGALGTPYELIDTTDALTDAFIGADPIPSLFEYLTSDPTSPFFGAVIPTTDYLSAGSIQNGFGQQADHWTIETESMALFTHNEISFTDQLVLTLGVRFNHETKDIVGALNSNLASCAELAAINTATNGGAGGIVSLVQAFAGLDPLAAQISQLFTLACPPQLNTVANSTSGSPWSGSREENEWSGTASLRYHLNDDLMVYGGYSRGYKSGGFNADRSGFSIFPGQSSTASIDVDSQLGFDPEFVDSVEVGLRSTIFGGTTFFNATLFYAQLHDYQSNNFNGSAFITENVPESITQGLELDFLSRLTDNLTIQGGLAYTDAYYDSTVAFVPGSAADTITAGQNFADVPEWAVTGAITYELPLSDSLGARFYIDGRWNSETQTQTLGRDPLGRTDQDSYAIFNARVSLGNPNGRWAVDVWGRNITDETTIDGFGAPLQPGSYQVFVNEPRVWGVTLKARY